MARFLVSGLSGVLVVVGARWGWSQPVSVDSAPVPDDEDPSSCPLPEVSLP